MKNKSLYAGILALLVVGFGVTGFVYEPHQTSSSLHALEAVNSDASPSQIAPASQTAISVLASPGQSQADARDATRMSDLRTVQNALKLYFQACGFYPGGGGQAADCAYGVPRTWADFEAVIAKVIPSITSLPDDPLAPTQTYTYMPNFAFSGYALTATLENPANAATSESVGSSPDSIAGTCGVAGLYCVTF